MSDHPAMRGPNYDWKAEAEHNQKECDNLRDLCTKLEASAERDVYRLQAELAQAKDRCEKLRIGHEAMTANDQMTFGDLYIQRDELKIRLKENLDEWTECVKRESALRADWLESREEIKQLKAEVERLKSVAHDINNQRIVAANEFDRLKDALYKVWGILHKFKEKDAN